MCSHKFELAGQASLFLPKIGFPTYISIANTIDTRIICHVVRLVHLDLIMFGISSTLADVLQLLQSLRTLSVWPVEVC